jgi:hypothetical protein
MIRVYDFTCSECSYTEEKFVHSDSRESVCSECNSLSHRQLAAPISKLDPHSGDFAGATIKWAKQRQKQIERERSTS